MLRQNQRLMSKKTQAKPKNGNDRVSVLVSLHPDVLAAIDRIKDQRKIHRGVVIDEKFMPQPAESK